MTLVLLSLLLIGSVATADDYDKYDLIPEQKGEIVQRDGYNATQDYVDAVRECQLTVEGMGADIEEAPARESKGFLSGVGLGAGGVLLLLLLL